MILITGATGQLGKKVIETLLKHLPAKKIAALVRDVSKAKSLKERGIDIRLGDYNDMAALAQAMQGVEKVLLVLGGSAENGLEQHQNVVDAANIAGIKLIAYTSRCMKDRNTLANNLMKRHFDTEDYILGSGMNYIFFRNILYMDAMAIFIGKNVLETDISLPAGDGRVSYAMRCDQAEAIGNVLAINDNSTRTFDFTNAQTYSFYDVADALSELSGKKITYTPVDAATFHEKAKAQGLPEFVAATVVSFMTDIQNGQESTVDAAMEVALGRKPLSLKEGLKILYNL